MLHNTTQHNTTQHNTTQHVDYLSQRLFVNGLKKSLLIFKGLVDSFCILAFLKEGADFA
ncbi:hypothetical protein LRI_0539 [Limosilactobacillus reuteri I5007]|uniref:Uncharacterized protein n=1 Tax=Limosilactobacillus reuteri I5007 TaxID=1340495 RepID=R9WGC2_LIMRT|nr:hypothetical protein [Limosilactobacillus reuteri]AGN98748.1 hypothetical protein LRI_0539 [Limosilactobacillus reuteri I5007]UCN17973.1 hypothetical protein LEP65_02600 [Limosilactobacillus reuteri]UCN19740.1 hypothetical protein LEP61_02605 [Limosilactobacillus reuteri]